MNRVHIVGLSPRTGTTLMMELMVHCFTFDAYADHEMSIFHVPKTPVTTFCSKKPCDLEESELAANRDPNLWVICMVRDPRDVVVSKHQNDPEAYWANLSIFKNRYDHFIRAQNFSRFITVQYEELVHNPEAVQNKLEAVIPFLRKKASFIDFHKVAAPTKKAVIALGGVREITTSSIGNWRNHLPRLKAQIELHGDISNMLIELGYEEDSSWTHELNGVIPNNGKSHFSDNKDILKKRLKRRINCLKNYWCMRIGIPKKKKVILASSDNI